MKIMNQKGVSLLETMVVVAIIGIFSLVVGPRYSVYKRTKSLNLSHTQIVNDLRRVQSYTLSNVEFLDGTFPRGGYGIHFDKNSGQYIMFADRGTSPDKMCDIAFELYELGDLTDEVTITDLRVRGVSKDYVDLVSVPPYGVIFIDGNNKYLDEFIDLEIEFSNGYNSDVITVISSGYIN